MKGFTLIEMMITVAIVALLATVAMPLAEVTVQRSKETELRHSLRDLREAIDAYKHAVDDGAIEKAASASGYPPSLAALVDGAVDKRDPNGARMYFLRRVPADPVSGQDWGLRSYESSADSPQPGKDVFDIYSRSPGVGLNGIPYRDW